MNKQKSRWPVNPVWIALEKVQFGGSSQLGLREKKMETSVNRIVAQFIGSLSSFAALRGGTNMIKVALELVKLARNYLLRREEKFSQRVAEKIKRRIGS